MPINDLKQRYQDSFRIRLGDRSGRNSGPVALTDRIRITAPNKDAVEAFAAKYGEAKGGEVRAWEDEWEVYLPITGLPIWIMPGDSLIQWWELYRGKVCDRRCDGEVEQLTKSPCLCPTDIDQRIEDKGSCKPMSRISVVCPDVAILGTGALVTHSRIAAETFPTAITLALPWLSRGRPVAGVLRTLTHKGRTTFTFPTIEILGPAQGFEDLELDAGAPSPPAIGTGSQREGSGVGHSAPPPAPPERTNPPFDGSNEKIVDPDVARALKAEALAAGLTPAQFAEIVADVAGTNVVTKVLREHWPALEAAIEAASAERAAS